MINAIVQNKQGETAVIDLTVHYHEIYKELQSLGYYGSPERLLLRDEEDEEYSVKLYSDSDIGNSMILLLNERDSLYDAYLLDLAVTNAREEIKTDLEQNLLHGQYTTFSEVLDDINQMKIAAAETRLTFFCPLEATIYDDEGYYSPASNYTISDNRDKIEDMLGIEQLPDLGDMAEYAGEHSGIGNKLIYAVWGLEEIRGEVYGKIDCYLTEALNAEETEKLRDAICGQNSDGFGESFEQRAIKTEDGELYVSFWNSNDDYFLYMELLPNDHKAKWFAGAALNTAEQSMASVMSTALSRLNSFLDSELEQLLCFDTEIDAEKFCNEKSAIFVIMPEENPNTFFMISLIIQQLYREILAVADENGGKLQNRCVFFCDEFGTLPKIESAEMMFSASRSRRLQIVPIIQSFSQLDKNYGKEGAEIIVDNTQLTIFGGFAPNSSSAEVLSKALGSRTVMSGSVNRSKNDPSQSLQMIERPLLTPDELKSMPKGQFVVMKTGVHPMRVRLKLFYKWGIKFDKDNPYTVTDNGGREVEYAEKQEIIEGIMKKYRKKEYEEMKEAEAAATAGGQDQAESQSNEPQQTPPKKSSDKKKGGNELKPEPPSRRHSPPNRAKQEVKQSEQT